MKELILLISIILFGMYLTEKEKKNWTIKK